MKTVTGVTRLRGLVALMGISCAFAAAGVKASGPNCALTKAQVAAMLAGSPASLANEVRYGFVANDPLHGQQWHLGNGIGWSHVNIQGAWDRGLTGAGVTIGIVDDGLEYTHPDLAPNYSAADSYDFGSIVQDGDPAPVYDNTTSYYGDNHGTSVAGVAAARGGNGVGGSGAAPMATLAGLRLDFINPTNASQVADATRYRSTGAAPTIDIKNHSYGIAAPYIPRADGVQALAESTSAGTIHVFAAGNERGRGGFADGDANKKAYQGSVNAITVAALDYTGKHSSYSNWGANVFVTAPTSGSGVGITTTDRTGGGVSGGYNHATGGGDGDSQADLDYTSVFGGTSSASPLVAGVLALAKEANPNLDTRMAKHLLALTSDSTIDAFDNSETSDGGWKTNAAGYTFNQNYGFGLIDADALTLAATQYSGVTELQQEFYTGTVNQTMPDAVVNNTVAGTVVDTFELTLDGPLEEMIIDIDAIHTYRGDLQATLESPSGTTSRLMMRNINDSVDDLSWSFVTNAFWGEEAAGEWTLTLEDWFSGDTGVWNGYSVTANSGSLILAVPEPTAVLLLAVCFGSAVMMRHRLG